MNNIYSRKKGINSLLQLCCWLQNKFSVKLKNFKIIMKMVT